MAEDIIKALVETYEGKHVVRARALHTALDMREQYSNWSQRQINRFGLVEGKDYARTTADNPRGVRRLSDLILAKDAALRIATYTSPYGRRDAVPPLPVPHASTADATAALMQVEAELSNLLERVRGALNHYVF